MIHRCSYMSNDFILENNEVAIERREERGWGGGTFTKLSRLSADAVDCQSLKNLKVRALDVDGVKLGVPFSSLWLPEFSIKASNQIKSNFISSDTCSIKYTARHTLSPSRNTDLQASSGAHLRRLT